MLDGGLATIVEEILGKVDVLLLASNEIQTGHRHLCNLVARHHRHLSGVRTHLTDGTVSIAAGDIEELTLARGLIIGNGTLDHMSEVIQLMTQVLVHAPALITGPLMRLLRVLRTCGIEVSVRLLCRADHIDDGVTVGLQFLIRIGLQDIGRTFERLVRIGIVEGQTTYLEHFRGIFQVFSGVREVRVTACLLTFREGERDGHLTAGLQTLAPEGAWCYFH